MIKNSYSGKFIVFEGLDGSGQSTQAAFLKDFLVGKGFKVILTKEPTKTSDAGKKIRQVLDQMIEVQPQSLQELFVEDRREHLANLVAPALQKGDIVISDRYFFSTFAYGASGGIDLDWLIKINSEFLLPDLTIILKASPEVCLSRIEKRGEGIKLFEKLEKLKKVWQTYEILPGRFENVYIINGEKPIEEVSSEVKSLVHSKLNL